MAAELRHIGGEEIRTLMPPAAARRAVAEAYQAIGRGELSGPVRSAIGADGQTSLLMPALSQAHVGLKVLHLRPENPARGLPAIVGEMLLWDRRTGELRAVIDAAALTAVRTAALAGHATKLLAPEGTRRVALLGAGGQAYDQALALVEATGARELRLWNRTGERAVALAARLGMALYGVGIAVAPTPAAAVADAGAVTLVTASATPLLHAGDLPAEAHLNAMGAYRPDMAELAPEIIGSATVYVDDIAGAREEAGDLVQAADRGLFRPEALQDLRAVKGGRQGWTVFKSVGAAIFDLAVGEAIWAAAGTR